MRFLKIQWIHSHNNEPHLIYQEVNAESQETRKIELLKNGNLLGYACEKAEFGDSILADQPIPSIEEINHSDEFNAEYITRDEFEKVWTSAINSNT